ncbi:MAG: dTDP-glucose 4,6-dehydratase [Thermoprotei archaeon]
MRLVLGGAGFIGSAMVRVLGEAVVFDALTYAGRRENLEDVRHVFVQGDILDRRALEEVVKKYEPDVVFNFAAQTHVDRSIVDPEPFVRTNVEGTVNVLELARTHKFRYVHVSTDEVYGEQEAAEGAPLRPSSPYSASKAAADMFVHAYVRTYGVDALIVRPSNNYGPRQFPEKLIPKSLLRLLKGLEVPLYGDGMQVRDWIYVEDTVKVIARLADEGASGKVYNIPGGQLATNMEVVNIVGEIVGVEPNVRFVGDRPGHDRFYRMSTSLKYDVTPLREGLRRTVEWYLANRWWWEPLVQDRYYGSDEAWRS